MNLVRTEHTEQHSQKEQHSPHGTAQPSRNSTAHNEQHSPHGTAQPTRNSTARTEQHNPHGTAQPTRNSTNSTAHTEQHSPHGTAQPARNSAPKKALRFRACFGKKVRNSSVFHVFSALTVGC
jgi:uncharacterized membrane protein